MKKKALYLTNEQLEALVRIDEALAKKVIPYLPFSHDWVAELMNSPAYRSYYQTGINIPSTNPKDYDFGYSWSPHFEFISERFAKLKHDISCRFHGWKGAYEIRTSPKLPVPIPTVDELKLALEREYEEADNAPEEEDYELFDEFHAEREEGPFGNAFSSEEDYISWREGKGFLNG